MSKYFLILICVIARSIHASEFSSRLNSVQLTEQERKDLNELRIALQSEESCDAFCKKWASEYPYDVDAMANPTRICVNPYTYIGPYNWADFITDALRNDRGNAKALKVAGVVQKKRTDQTKIVEIFLANMIAKSHEPEFDEMFNHFKGWFEKYPCDIDTIQFYRLPDFNTEIINNYDKWCEVADLVYEERSKKESLFQEWLNKVTRDDSNDFAHFENWFQKHPMNIDDPAFDSGLTRELFFRSNDLEKSLKLAHVLQPYRTHKNEVFECLFDLYSSLSDETRECPYRKALKDWVSKYPAYVDSIKPEVSVFDDLTYGQMIDAGSDAELKRIFKSMRGKDLRSSKQGSADDRTSWVTPKTIVSALVIGVGVFYCYGKYRSQSQKNDDQEKVNAPAH